MIARDRIRFPAYLGLGLLSIAGLTGISIRLLGGLKTTALTSYVPWGLWVSTYIFLIGLAGGAVFVTSLYVLFGRHEFRILTGPAFLISILSLAGGLVFIWLDLGQPLRFFYLYLHPNWDSAMIWEAWAYPLFLAVASLSLYVWLHDSPHRIRKKIKILDITVCLLALFVIWDSGASFARNIARPLWSGTEQQALAFVVLAVISGIGILLFLHNLYHTRPYGLSLLDREMTLILVMALLLHAFMEGSKIWMALSGIENQTALEAWKTILYGPYWYVFWIGQVGFLFLLPMTLSFAGFRTNKPVYLGLTGLLVLAGVFSARLNFIIPGLAFSPIPGLESAYQSVRLSTVYVPNVLEWIVTIGIFAFLVLCFLISNRILSRRLLKNG